MSGKGDKRRPGTGYADNWDRIFGKKEERKPSGGQIWMRKSAMESPYMEQAAAARALEDAQQDVRDGAIARPPKTCKECAHASDILECRHPDIRSFLLNNSQVDFLVTSDFGCNRWEGKV